ncbi:hypothetical protein F511_07951 [Dorcoceras hygrometricum]|uniref:Uncharacterized protein n=1 Tax=Dorcoceras hygrometricum TaxID=472368 RepID=A0A2Z7C8F1_9LAMI|nr:hypothetical protein F511_07951 [Dorcoceras hygrometricum]
MSTGYAKLATGFIARSGSLKLSTGCAVACVWLSSCSLRLDFLLYDVASLLRLDVQVTCWYLATSGLKPSADYDDTQRASAESSLRLDFLLYDVASLLRLDVQVTCWYLATSGLKPSADYDDVTDDVCWSENRIKRSAAAHLKYFRNFRAADTLELQ